MSRDKAWFLVGDVKELMYKNEKLGGPERPDSTFWDFRNLALTCKIREVQSSGNWYSWVVGEIKSGFDAD